MLVLQARELERLSALELKCLRDSRKPSMEDIILLSTLIKTSISETVTYVAHLDILIYAAEYVTGKAASVSPSAYLDKHQFSLTHEAKSAGMSKFKNILAKDGIYDDVRFLSKLAAIESTDDFIKVLDIVRAVNHAVTGKYIVINQPGPNV